MIFNEDLKRINIKLYELLGASDALITDFSSVYFDYLLLDKPIGFATDDLKDYKNNRGYTVEDPLSIMPGEKIQNIDEFKSFLTNVSIEHDSFQEERFRVNNLVNSFKEGNACQRILDYLEIKK